MTTHRDGPVEADQHPTILSWHRVLVCLAAGLVAGAVVAVAGLPEAAVLTGWIVAGGGLLAWTWRIGWPRDAEQTRELAEDEGRTRATDTAVLGAAVISLVAVVEALVRSSSTDATGIVTVVLGVVVVFVSWALVTTVFALKYARSYYADGSDGGIDFGQEELPAYSDFAYLAFSVGMTFSVPDTQLVATAVRKVALGHALLSYVFGTVVVAVAVNLVTDLGS